MTSRNYQTYNECRPCGSPLNNPPDETKIKRRLLILLGVGAIMTVIIISGIAAGVILSRQQRRAINARRFSGLNQSLKTDLIPATSLVTTTRTSPTNTANQDGSTTKRDEFISVTFTSKTASETKILSTVTSTTAAKTNPTDTANQNGGTSSHSGSNSATDTSKTASETGILSTVTSTTAAKTNPTDTANQNGGTSSHSGSNSATDTSKTASETGILSTTSSTTAVKTSPTDTANQNGGTSSHSGSNSATDTSKTASETGILSTASSTTAAKTNPTDTANQNGGTSSHSGFNSATDTSKTASETGILSTASSTTAAKTNPTDTANQNGGTSSHSGSNSATDTSKTASETGILTTATSKTTAGCEVLVENNCFSNLASAVQTAKSGTIVTVNQNIVVSNPINITQASLTFQGKNGATVTSMLNNGIHGAILNLLAEKEQTIILRDIKFDNKGVYGSVLRTPSLGDKQPAPGEPKYEKVHLTMEGCNVNGFKTGARGGGAIFIGKAGKINIRDSIFSNNECVVPKGMHDRFNSGGGAIWIRWQMDAMKITNSTFRANQHGFQHGAGGAVYIIDQGFKEGPFTGTVDIDRRSKFTKNKAASGGAFTIINNFAPITINGWFDENTAFAPTNWNGRAGAMWVQFVNSTCNFGGIFSRNTAIKGDGNNTSIRGATLTSNVIWPHGRVILSGRFTGNTCPAVNQTGMVWEGASKRGSVRSGGVITVKHTAIIMNNGLDISPIINLNNKEVHATRISRTVWEEHVKTKKDLVIMGID